MHHCETQKHDEPKVYIFGAGGAGKRVAQKLLKDVRLLGFIDNDSSKSGSTVLDYPVFLPDVLMDSEYDYVIVSSAYSREILPQLESMGINTSKIIDINMLFWDFALQSRLDAFREISPGIEAISVGMSYTMYGIIEKACDIQMFNFAIASQDIYYNCKIIDAIISNYTIENLKYVVFETTRFCLHYDMSKRRDCDIVSRYINTIGHHHNAESTKNKINTALNLFQSDFLETEYLLLKNSHDNHFNKIQNLAFKPKPSPISDSQVAEQEHNKYYPNTFEENRSLLKSTIDLLQKMNIKAIFYSPPATQEYLKSIPDEIQDECIHEITSLANGRDVFFFGSSSIASIQRGTFFWRITFKCKRGTLAYKFNKLVYQRQRPAE